MGDSFYKGNNLGSHVLNLLRVKESCCQLLTGAGREPC